MTFRSNDRDEGWERYVARFHTERPGITEALLSRIVDDTGRTPYEWITSGLPGGVVLDVGCGSAPTRAGVAGWLGVDRSHAELAVARSRGRGPLVAASADRVPVRSGTVDAVLAVMSLMVLDDPVGALDELHRVLRPGGVVHALLPANSPLGPVDRARYGLLLAVLGRTALPFPHPEAAADPARLLGPAGFTIDGDDRRRFRLQLTGRADADLFVDSLYLPGISRRRVDLGRAATRIWGRTELGIPLRRITATAQAASAWADSARRSSASRPVATSTDRCPGPSATRASRPAR